jgi:hypothetical protein
MAEPSPRSLRLSAVDVAYRTSMDGTDGGSGAREGRVSLSVGGDPEANYVQFSIDYDTRWLHCRGVEMLGSAWVLSTKRPLLLSPDGRIQGAILRTDDGSGETVGPAAPEAAVEVLVLVFDLKTDELPASDYRQTAAVGFTSFDTTSITQDPRERSFVGLLDGEEDDRNITVLDAELIDGAVTVYYRGALEVAGGALTRRSQSFSLPLYVTRLEVRNADAGEGAGEEEDGAPEHGNPGGEVAQVDLVTIGVDYDELILRLREVRPQAPAGEGHEDAAVVDVHHEPCGAGFKAVFELALPVAADGHPLLREHVADLVFEYYGPERAPAPAAPQGVGCNGAGGGANDPLDGAESLSIRPLLLASAAQNPEDVAAAFSAPGRLEYLEPHFVRGNVDSSVLGSAATPEGAFAPELADPVATLRWLFLASDGALPCFDAADTDNDGKIQIADAVLLLNFLFGSGQEPRPPFPLPGTDPADPARPRSGHLGCARPLPVFEAH